MASSPLLYEDPDYHTLKAQLGNQMHRMIFEMDPSSMPSASGGLISSGGQWEENEYERIGTRVEVRRSNSRILNVVALNNNQGLMLRNENSIQKTGNNGSADGMGNMRKLAGQSGYDFLNKKVSKGNFGKSFPIRDRSGASRKSPQNVVALRRRPREFQQPVVRSKERITSENNLTTQSSAHNNGRAISKKSRTNLDIASYVDENGGDICNINVPLPDKKLALHQAYHAQGLLPSQNHFRQQQSLTRVPSSQRNLYFQSHRSNNQQPVKTDFNFRPIREQISKLNLLTRTLSTDCSKTRETFNHLATRLSSVERAQLQINLSNQDNFGQIGEKLEQLLQYIQQREEAHRECEWAMKEKMQQMEAKIAQEVRNKSYGNNAKSSNKENKGVFGANIMKQVPHSHVTSNQQLPLCDTTVGTFNNTQLHHEQISQRHPWDRKIFAAYSKDRDSIPAGFLYLSGNYKLQ